MTIEVVAEGVVYRNPYPHIRTRHAWHPTLVHLDGPRWLVGFDLGEAAEAHRYSTRFTFTDDDGATWSEPRRIMPAGEPPRSYSVRLSKTSEGVVAAGAHHGARPENQGRLNPETFGYNTMELVQLRLDGDEWSGPVPLNPPLTGTQFETCHAIVELSDGRWVLPTCTWMNWDGSAPHGMKGILLVSRDHGATWPEHIVTMDDWEHRVTHFEQSLVELEQGALLVVAWAYNVDTGATGPTPYAISTDGQTFDVHGVTDLHAQTAKLVRLPDGRLLCAYRRHDERGLWLALVSLDGNEWHTISTQRIWNGAASGMSGEGNQAEELSDLRFGFPQMAVRPDGDVQLVFWARHDDINEIRWMRLAVPA